MYIGALPLGNTITSVFKEKIPGPRSGAAAERSNPTSKRRWRHGHRRAKRSYSKFKVRMGGGEEISLVQGKEHACVLLELL